MKLIASLLMLALAACAPTIQVTQDYDPEAPLASLRTWAWQPDVSPPTGDPRLDSELMHTRVKSAIQQGLAAKGFVEQPSPAGVDFTVAYHLALNQKLDAHTIYTGYGPYRGWGGSSRTYVDQYEVGSLIVDFVSPATNRVIWRGTAQSRVNEGRSPEEREQLVRAAVDELLAQFPPQPK